MVLPVFEVHTMTLNNFSKRIVFLGAIEQLLSLKVININQRVEFN